MEEQTSPTWKEAAITSKATINFNSPIATRDRFDALCRASGKTRTAVLVHLMETFILTQPKILAERKAKFDKVDDLIAGKGEPTSNWNRPPDIFRSDGQNIW